MITFGSKGNEISMERKTVNIFSIFGTRSRFFWLFFATIFLVVGLPILCAGLYFWVWSTKAVPDPFLPVAFITMGGIATSLGGFVLFGVRRIERLSKEGLPVDGTVFEIGPSWLSINRVRQWTIRYHYRDHMGRILEGQSGPISPDEASTWQVGDKGSVRYDYGHPRHSLWIGKE